MNDSEILLAFGNRVKELREKLGWTQEELGLKISVKQYPKRSNPKSNKLNNTNNPEQKNTGLATIDRQGINRIEKGKTNISVVLLVKISKALGVSVGDLLIVDK